MVVAAHKLYRAAFLKIKEYSCIELFKDLLDDALCRKFKLFNSTSVSLDYITTKKLIVQKELFYSSFP